MKKIIKAERATTGIETINGAQFKHAAIAHAPKAT